MTPRDFIDGHEADIVPVLRVLRAGIAEANEEQHDAAFPTRRDTSLLLLVAAGGCLGGGGRLRTGRGSLGGGRSRSSRSGRGSRSTGRRRTSRAGSSSRLLFLGIAGRRHD